MSFKVEPSERAFRDLKRFSKKDEFWLQRLTGGIEFTIGCR